MAKATIEINDKENGMGITYRVILDPPPKTKKDVTLAQNIGLTLFDALESQLKNIGAKLERTGGKLAQT